MTDSSSALLTLEGLYFEGAVEPRHERRPARPPPAFRVDRIEQDEESRDFFRWVFELTEFPPHGYRTRPLVRRLPACLRFLRVKTIAEARDRIARQPALAGELMNVVLLGVTQFWRDEPVFESLMAEILPPLLARQNRLRIWSAACSEGQELYSIGMALDELGGLHRADLLGTDCRVDAIIEARRGCYDPAGLALTRERQERYFRPAGKLVEIEDRLRSVARWKVANLFAVIEPGPWDVIFWRNMSIYIEAAPADRIWRGLVQELAPGGCLVVGKADHPPAFLGLTKVAPCIFRHVKA